MTKIRFIGTGEAFDPNRSNASYLIENEDGTLMVDCGYDSPKSLVRKLNKQGRNLSEVPDGLLITHWHGDHCAGIPALLMPMWEEAVGIVGKNKKGLDREFTIASAHSDLIEKVKERMNDYPTFYERFSREGPKINYKVVSGNDSLFGYNIKSALTSHGVANYAYKFEREGQIFAISGDGALTDASKELFKGVELLIHEGFNVMGSGGKNHASIQEVVDFTIANKIPRVAIVHVNREEREKKREIAELIKRANCFGIDVFLPEDHQTVSLSTHETIGQYE